MASLMQRQLPWPNGGVVRCSAKSLTNVCSSLGAMATCSNIPIARAYADARVQKIYGGTNEIMKELIARSL